MPKTILKMLKDQIKNKLVPINPIKKTTRSPHKSMLTLFVDNNQTFLAKLKEGNEIEDIRIHGLKKQFRGLVLNQNQHSQASNDNQQVVEVIAREIEASSEDKDPISNLEVQSQALTSDDQTILATDQTENPTVNDSLIPSVPQIKKQPAQEHSWFTQAEVQEGVYTLGITEHNSNGKDEENDLDSIIPPKFFLFEKDKIYSMPTIIPIYAERKKI